MRLTTSILLALPATTLAQFCIQGITATTTFAPALSASPACPASYAVQTLDTETLCCAEAATARSVGSGVGCCACGALCTGAAGPVVAWSEDNGQLVLSTSSSPSASSKTGSSSLPTGIFPTGTPGTASYTNILTDSSYATRTAPPVSSSGAASSSGAVASSAATASKALAARCAPAIVAGVGVMGAVVLGV